MTGQPETAADVEAQVKALLGGEGISPGPDEIPALIDAYRSARARVDLVRGVRLSCPDR
jgi:hypothetical protein